MPIGLTHVELQTAFLDCFDKRMRQSDVELTTADMGLNPLTKTELERIQKQYGFSNTLALRDISIVMAVIDTIAINNEAISKSINS
jgi:hypothetical protein